MPTLNVTIERVAYPPATATDATWFILVTSQGTAKGCMAWRPQDGDALTLEGEWTSYQGNREFKFQSARLNVPVEPRDQLHYVATRTSGMGPAMEQLIWEKAGANWQKIPDDAVPRFRGKVYAEFQLQVEALSQKTEEARVVAVLLGKGATVNMAQAAWEMWKGETLGVVNSDPYRLAELPNYSFRDVDKEIRKQYGIADGDVRRIKAAVVYALRRLTDAGDTVVQWEDLYRQACGLLGGYEDEIAECTKGLFEDGSLRAFPKSEGVSLKADWDAENAIWEYVESVTREKGGGE